MAFTGRSTFPQGGLGYTRGSDFIYGGSGSGKGMPAQGTASLGQGIGPVGGMGGDWHPTVLYLLGLIVGEMVVFHIIGRILK